MKKAAGNQKGFTLVELMFALSMFSLMMIIATVGFVAMSRSYTRGLARKQLSESSQRIVASIDNSITNTGLGSYASCRAADDEPIPDACPELSGKWQGALCFEGERYIWGSDGLFRQAEDCDVTLPESATGEELLSARFRVDRLNVEQLGDKLYAVKAVLRTENEEAFTFDEDDPTKTICNPTSGAAQVCAIEVVDTVINARGDGSTGDEGGDGS